MAGSIVGIVILFPRNNHIYSQKTKRKAISLLLIEFGNGFIYEIVSNCYIIKSLSLFKVFASFNQNLPSVFDDYALVVSTYFLASQIIHLI